MMVETQENQQAAEHAEHTEHRAEATSMWNETARMTRWPDEPSDTHAA